MGHTQFPRGSFLLLWDIRFSFFHDTPPVSLLTARPALTLRQSQQPIYDTFARVLVFDSKVQAETMWHLKKLTNKAKKKALAEDPSRFDPNVKATFPDIDNLPLTLRNGHQIFSLRGSDFVSRGNAIRFPLSQEWWLNIHLRMMGRVVVISKKKLAQMNHARLHDRSLCSESLSNNRHRDIVLRVDRSERGIYYTLKRIVDYSGQFTLLTASFDDPDWFRQLIVSMRDFKLIEPVHVRASRI